MKVLSLQARFIRKKVLKTPFSLTTEKEHTLAITVDELFFHSIRHIKLPRILLKNTLLSSCLGLMLQPQNIKLTINTWAWNVPQEPGQWRVPGCKFHGGGLAIQNLWAQLARPSYYASSQFNCLHVTLLSTAAQYSGRQQPKLAKTVKFHII